MPDTLTRENLKKFLDNSSQSLENIMRHLLFELLPVCYLEGFEDLIKNAKEQHWPKFLNLFLQVIIFIMTKFLNCM